jgi:hypothetical protein
MHRGEEQGRVGGEGRLSAVAMMHVEIHHCYAGETRRLRRPGADGDVREEAKAHRSIGFRMMPRWANRAERPLKIAPGDALNRVDYCACGP